MYIEINIVKSGQIKSDQVISSFDITMDVGTTPPDACVTAWSSSMVTGHGWHIRLHHRPTEHTQSIMLRVSHKTDHSRS